MNIVDDMDYSSSEGRLRAETPGVEKKEKSPFTRLFLSLSLRPLRPLTSFFSHQTSSGYRLMDICKTDAKNGPIQRTTHGAKKDWLLLDFRWE